MVRKDGAQGTHDQSPKRFKSHDKNVTILMCLTLQATSSEAQLILAFKLRPSSSNVVAIAVTCPCRHARADA